MSQENVDLVTRIYADGLLDSVDGQKQLLRLGLQEYVNPPDAVDPGVRRGDAVAEALSSLTRAFDRPEHRLRQTYDAGSSVVADVTYCGRGAASGLELEQREAHTWTFEGRRLLRFEWGRYLPAA